MWDRSSEIFNLKHNTCWIGHRSDLPISFLPKSAIQAHELPNWTSISNSLLERNSGSDNQTDKISTFVYPIIYCPTASTSSAYGRFLALYGRYSRFAASKPAREPFQDSDDSRLSIIDNLLEYPLTQKQQAIRKLRHLHQFDRKISIRNTRRGSVSSQRLDHLLSNLNLNELSLSAVHVAMGLDGSAQKITPKKEAYYRQIFDILDVDNDGKVDVTELKQAYSEMGLLQVPGQAEKFVTASDSNKDGELDVTEFVKYLHEHEMKLKLMFKKIDRDKDGRISPYEMIQALKSVGLTISDEEANAVMKRMDKDGTSSIDLDEWVEHHLLHPSTDIKDIVFYWRHATYMDIGENLLVPDVFSEDEIVTGRWWKLLVSGGVAGAVSRTCTAPLDRLKVLMQVHASKTNDLGIKSGFNALLNEGGARGLWRGNGINVIKIAPESAIKFFAFERLKNIVNGGSEHEMGMRHRFIAGSLAGAISQTCIYPMEVIKTRLALRKTGQYRGIVDCAMKIYANEGPRAFFKGYVPNLLGILPYAGIDLCIYETIRNYWVKHHSTDSHAPSVLLLLACGTTSSTCGQLASYPLALIRTKMQAAKASSNSVNRPTMFSLAKSIFNNEGFAGFYRGIGPNFLKVAPAVSISYVVYENMKQELGIARDP
ncbi:mitochondrial adenyl nucleotide antiporter SLC25A24-B-like [Styela clava]